MTASIIKNPSAQDIQDIRNGLIEHNAPYLKELRRYEIGNFRYKQNGDKCAGIIGEIWGDWLLVQFLWVDGEHKGNGVGSQLLREFETYALEQGCHSCLLDTFSFQARPFYEKQGYHCVMTMEQFPVSTKKYYMMKSLVSDSEK